MTTKQKKIFSIAALMSTFVVAVGVFFSGSKFSSLRTSFAKATGPEYSITFTRDNEYSADDSSALYVYRQTTQLGNDIYLVSSSENGQSRGSAPNMSVVPRDGGAYKSSNIKFYRNSALTEQVFFQNLNSVTVKTTSSISMKVQTSSDGISFKDKYTFTCDSTGGSCSGFTEIDRYILITDNVKNATSCGITEVSFTYQCENSISVPTLQKTYSTTVVGEYDDFTDYNVIMHFNTDGYGRLEFGNNNKGPFYVNYKWERETDFLVKLIYFYTPPTGTTYEGTLSSGTKTDYQKYCLFVRFNEAGKFYNYVSLFDGKISLVFHTTTQGTSFTDKDNYFKYSQRENITILNAQ